MKFLLKAGLTALLLLIVLSGLWIWHEAEIFLKTPPESHGKDVYFDVQQGAHLGQIAKDLAQKGLITDARKFTWLARIKKQGNKLQAGRFLLNSGWKPEKILESLVNGKPILFRITIPEGLTWWQTARLLEEAGFVRFEDFAKIVADPDFLRHYGIPFATAEGFLMPDTYLLKKPDTPMPRAPAGAGTESVSGEDKIIAEQWQAQARSVAGRLVDNFWRKASGLWPKNQTEAKQQSNKIRRPAAEQLKKWVILASIVEKETGIDAERPRVAGVYANRLAKNMLLQADPTVIYGLGPEFSGSLRRAQLNDATNPYNTYQKQGLTPGPIASFGIAALKAAIQPEKHDYLYFVAITDGGQHAFSKTLEEHNRAVIEYRKQKKTKAYSQ